MEMNLGLDIDDTITKFPERFSRLSIEVKNLGGSVHIVSSRSDEDFVRTETKKELEKLGIQYDKLYLLPAMSIAEKICPHKELDWYQKYLWMKVKYCKENGIDNFYDDDEKVIALFKRYAPEIEVFKV